MSLSCPNCNSTHIKKNGHIHNGKQNHCCKECGRQFVFNPQQILISSAKRERIQRLLIERIPLRGICRTEGVSLRWLLGFMVDLYDKLPDDFFFQVKGEAEELMIYTRGSGRVVAMRCHKVFFVAENFRFRVWHWHFYPFFAKNQQFCLSES